MIFLLGLVGVTLLTACVAVIILTVKLGSDSPSSQVARAQPPVKHPPQPTVVTQVPPQSKPVNNNVIPAPPAATTVKAVDAENPWSLKTPNVLGVPVRGHTAIVVDAIEKSEPFLAPVLDALDTGLGHAGGNATASVFYINSDKIKSFDDNPAAVGPATSAKLSAFQKSIKPDGRRGFWKGFDAAASSGASQIVIITGRKSWDSSIPFLTQKLNSADNAPLVTFVHIDADVASLRNTLRDTANGYRPIPLDQLNAWHNAAP